VKNGHKSIAVVNLGGSAAYNNIQKLLINLPLLILTNIYICWD
jgi:hypothetical protein